MKRARIVIASLVVAQLLLHAFVVCAVLPKLFVVASSSIKPITPPMLWVVLFWVGPSQGALFALWIALGGKRTVRRVLLAVAVAVLCLSFVSPTSIKNG
jgi:hypothetical protein